MERWMEFCEAVLEAQRPAYVVHWENSSHREGLEEALRRTWKYRGHLGHKPICVIRWIKP